MIKQIPGSHKIIQAVKAGAGKTRETEGINRTGGTGMDTEILEYYIEAGRIASSVRKQTLNTVEEGGRLLDTAEYAEELTRQMGGEAAFPCNISINEIASHYTPLKGDRKFASGDLVKIDIGVHINGYIADTANTIEVDTNHNRTLIKAAREALNAAVNEIQEGVNTKYLGKVIENVIKSYNCVPMTDLTGHSMERYIIHSGVNIPNYGSASYGNVLHAGDVVAVEPFTTLGRGGTRRGEVRIYSLVGNKDSKSLLYQKLLSHFNTLPFTRRLMDEPDKLDNMVLKLHKYPVLMESGGCPVAQAEHTVIVEDKGCRVITA
ncbi:MAG: type II methionyl aminopeptidase [ANME-2 cluster archaeon]|nr:type II methionyl aminopeptidase [ANME-2 cluster archaeon]